MKHLFGLFGVVLAGLCLFLAPAAEASPITWTLNFTLGDGSTGSGGFTYDFSANTFSNINITVSGGSLSQADATYSFVCTAACPRASNSTHIYFYSVAPVGNLSGQPLLLIGFDSNALANVGTVPFLSIQNGPCFDAVCDSTEPSRLLVSGSMTGVAPAPVPALSLSGSALFGLLLISLAALRLRYRTRA
jgi:hypothetical protein